MRAICEGQWLTVERNQGEREAEVLAIRPGLALIEYEMPNGTTALNVVAITEDEKLISEGCIYHAVSYRKVPKYWLKAMIAAELEWAGYGQREFRGGRYTFDEACAAAGISRPVAS